MKTRAAFTFLCLLTLAAHSLADEKASPGNDPTTVYGVWTSSFSRSPGSPDALMQQTLEIGLENKPEAVRLGWSLYCGRSRITGDYSYVGRLSGVEDKGQKRVLVFAGEKDSRYEVEFELSGDDLQLKGSIKGVDVSDRWKRQPAARK